MTLQPRFMSGWQQLQSGDAGHVADVGDHHQTNPNHGICLSCLEEFLAMKFGRVAEPSFSFDASGPLSPLQVAIGTFRIKFPWMLQQEPCSAIWIVPGSSWLVSFSCIVLETFQAFAIALSVFDDRVYEALRIYYWSRRLCKGSWNIFLNADIHAMASDIFLKLW